MELIPVMLYHISIKFLNNQDLLSNLINNSINRVKSHVAYIFLAGQQGAPYIINHNNANVIPGRF